MMYFGHINSQLGITKVNFLLLQIVIILLE